MRPAHGMGIPRLSMPWHICPEYTAGVDRALVRCFVLDRILFAAGEGNAVGMTGAFEGAPR
eukprot:10154770-Alexandrium_andersonii.AAC.1